MSDDRHERGVDDPAAAFAALSDPNRISILRALWEADGPLSFSALRTAVGMRDSGQFNYHLGKLRDRFVTGDEEGYRLQAAGRRVVGSVLSGAYTGAEDVGPIGLDDPCPNCGEPMTFRYEDEQAWFVCEGCELAAVNTVPAGVFEGDDPAAYPAVATRYLRARVRQLTGGFCTTCEAPLGPTVRAVEAVWPDETLPFTGVPFAVYDCERCGDRATADLGLALYERPVVVAFYHDHGVAVDERPIWSFMRLHDSAVDSTDPFRASVTYREGDGALTLVVDESLAVVASERS